MSKILLSINPVFVDKIFTGEKKVEYRRIKPKRDIDKIIIYATSPIKKVVGEATVSKILIDNPAKVWNKTSSIAGVDYDFYTKYYKNKDKAVAYFLSEIKEYDESKELLDIGVSNAPQSFIYLDDALNN